MTTEKYADIDNPKYFYEIFEYINPFYLLLLFVITFGIYYIQWFYKNNIIFEKLDESAPVKERVFYIMFLLPILWLILINIFLHIFKGNLYIKIISILGWLIILLLILLYLYDFGNSFGRITNTPGLFWFIILLLPIIGALAMQFEINSFLSKISIRKKRNIFYKV